MIKTIHMFTASGISSDAYSSNSHPLSVPFKVHLNSLTVTITAVFHSCRVVHTVHTSFQAPHQLRQ